METISPPLPELSQEQSAQLLRFARLELARRYARKRKILEWGKLLFPEKFYLPFCHELHDYLVSIRHISKTNTEAPRNHAKTLIECFLVPIFQALEEPHTFSHYLNVQSTEEKSLAINTSIKHEIETNQDLFDLYGNLIGKRWTDQQFVITHRDKKNGRPKYEIIFTGVGAGQSIRGLNYHNIRPDFITIDDLYNESDINNPDSTLKKNQWFWGSLYPARAKSRTNCIHLQGTAINEEDLLEKLKRMEDWKSKTFQAIKPGGEVLWPELNTIASLNQDRANMGSVIFERELQNIRRDDATAIIKRKWMKYYDPVELHARLMAFDRHFFLKSVKLCVDPSAKQKEENDFTGIALILETGYDDSDASEYWIENVWNEKLSLDGRVTLLGDINSNRPRELSVTDCRIESIGGFHDFTSEVIRRTKLPVTEIEAVKDKITNREIKSKVFENGRVSINKNIDPILMDILVHQLTTNHPRHDDVADAVLLAIDDDGAGWGFVKHL